MGKTSISLAILCAALSACASRPPQAAAPASGMQVVAQSGGRSDPGSSLQLGTGVHFGGGDGSSVDQAVSVLGATEATGVDAEYIWLHQRYPGYGSVNQSLLAKGESSYDVLVFKTQDGVEHTVYFDITDYFGKM